MFNKKKQQLREMRTEIASLRRSIDGKNDEIERLKAQIRDDAEASAPVTNEDIAQMLRDKIANEIKNLSTGTTEYWIGWAQTPLDRISDVERLVVTYLAFINITRSA